MFDSFGDGRYQVRRRLGEGGKGIVFLAQDTVLDRGVAIKVIKGEGLDEEGLQRVQREMRTMARLSHPNIVAIYDVGQEENQHYLVLEYVEGGDLEELTCRQAPLEAKAVVRIARGVAAALEYAHGRGIVHRDVKPGNIWLTEDGTAKLGDFGLAIATDLPKVTREGMTVGTVAYMPPEQALGRGYESRSDLYMLGATLYQLATGRPPFPGDDPVRVVFSHINDIPIPPRRLSPALPPDLEALILRLLAKEIDRRPQSARAVSEALAEIAAVLERTEAEDSEPQTPAAAVATPTPEPRWATPLLGRAEELDELRSHVNSALQGEGRLVFITGEAGIGKTRLATETRSHARLRGAEALEGRCDRRGGGMPYRPWVEMMKAYLNRAAAPRMTTVMANYGSELARLVPEIGEKQAAAPSVAQGPPQHEKSQLFDGLSAFFIRIAREVPLVMLLDDIQWVDDSSFEFLHHLAREVADKPILLLAAYRDSELMDRPSLTSILLEMNRERLFTTIALKRLGQPEVAEMIVQTFGAGLAELTDQVFEKTEGNPFFVEEVLRSLAEQGAVRLGARGWESAQVEDLALPLSVKALVEERLSRLEREDCKQLLTTASTIGSEFSFALLQNLMGWDEDSLIDALDGCIQQRLLVERRGAAQEIYGFADNQAREVLYESISPLRRRRLHRRIGQAMERVYGERLEEHIEELAHHFLEANDAKKAMEYAIKAGDKAREIYTAEQAIGHYQTALSVMEGQKEGEEQIAETLSRLGNAYANSANAEKGIEVLMEAVRRYENLNNPYMLAKVHWDLSLILMAQTAGLRNVPRAVRHLDEAARALEEDPEVSLLAQIYFSRSFTSWLTVRPAEGITWANKATILARQHMLYQYFGAAGMVIGFNQARQGQIETGKRLLEGIVRLALNARQREGAAIVGMVVTRFFGHLMDAVRMSEWMDRTMAIQEETIPATWAAENLGMYVLRPEEVGIRIFAHCLAGELDKAAEEAEELQRIIEETNSPGMAESSATAGLFYRWQGDWERAEEILKAAQENGNRCGDMQQVAMSAQWLGELYIDTGRYEDAAGELERSIAIYSDGEDLMGQVQTLPTLCRARACGGELDQAQEALDRCLAITSGPEDWHGLPSQVHLARATLEAARRNWEEASEEFQKAVDICQRFGLVLYRADAQLQWASAHLSRRWRGDEERARQLLEEALASFRSAGARQHAEKASAALQPITRIATRDTVEFMLPISGEEKERARDQVSHEGNVTIFFTDIESSTEMMERLGDENAQQVLRAHSRITRQEIQKQGGTEVKGQGDGFMVAFSNVRRAILCTIGIQQAIEGYNQDNPDEAIRVRIGLHTGQAIQEEEDFFGITVVKAARVTDVAQGGQIVVSDIVRELAGELTGIEFNSIGGHSLKGLRGKHLLYEVSVAG